MIIWCQACKTYFKKNLIRQKRVLRLMYFTDRNQHAILLFIKANTMPPSFLYYQLVSNLMHDIPNKPAPRNIQNLFKTTNDIHVYNTISSKSLEFLYQSSRHFFSKQ